MTNQLNFVKCVTHFSPGIMRYIAKNWESIKKSPRIKLFKAWCVIQIFETHPLLEIQIAKSYFQGLDWYRNMGDRFEECAMCGTDVEYETCYLEYNNQQICVCGQCHDRSINGLYIEHKNCEMLFLNGMLKVCKSDSYFNVEINAISTEPVESFKKNSVCSSMLCRCCSQYADYVLLNKPKSYSMGICKLCINFCYLVSATTDKHNALIYHALTTNFLIDIRSIIIDKILEISLFTQRRS